MGEFLGLCFVKVDKSFLERLAKDLEKRLEELRKYRVEYTLEKEEAPLVRAHRKRKWIS